MEAPQPVAPEPSPQIALPDEGGGSSEPYFNSTHFKDFPPFRLVRITDSGVIYERQYDYMPDFIPLKNERTGEVERAVFRIQISQDRKGTKRELYLSVFRHFVQGTDYSADPISDPNTKEEFVPVHFTSQGEFYWEDWSGKIRNGRKAYTLQQFLERLYQAHIRPTKKHIGLILRTEIAFHKKLPDFATRTYFPIVTWALRIICGKKLDLEPGTRVEWLSKEIPYNGIIADGSPTMRTYIGFECAKSTGIISLLVTLGVVLVLYFKTSMDQKGFLVVMAALLYTLVSLFFDYLLPILMVGLLNWMIRKSVSGRTYIRI